MHIAQMNVATARFETDDPRFAEFMNNLERVNALAERSPGFVWRLKDDSGNATNIRPTDNPLFLINMSVWETAEDLERFVFATVHRKFYARGEEWFEKRATPRLVLWPVPAGHTPTIEEGLQRLEKLGRDGESDEAFGWNRLAELKLWLKKRCA